MAAIVAVVAVLAIGCSPSGGPADRIRLTNQTNIAVAVHVNGGWAGTYPPGAVADVPIRGHGGPPFRVEVRSPSGASLAELTISASDVTVVADGSTAMSTGSGVPCGWIELAYGEVPDQGPVGGGGVAPAPPTGPCP